MSQCGDYEDIIFDAINEFYGIVIAVYFSPFTESTKLRKENCTIHVKKTRINNILIFNIFKIKWPKSEEKVNFGGRWVWLSESSPTQNFVVTAWPWPHLRRPAAAASAREEAL